MLIKSENHSHKVKLHLLFPVGLGVLLLLVSSIFVLKNLQEQNLNEEMSVYADHVETLFQSELVQESRSLQSNLDFLLRDVSLANLWMKKDRQALLEYSLPVYQTVLSKQDITHFYFMDPNCVCFLRVHQPDRCGDRIKRFTMAEAFKTGQTTYGIELGPLGTFTLRMVSPWKIDGKIQGYIELGREIQPIAEHLKNTLNVELVFIINKSYLDRASWEKGLVMLGQKKQWDQFPNFVVTGSTLDEIPADVQNYIGTMEECESEEHLESLFDVSWEGNVYKGKPIELCDASGKDVGDILILSNVHSKEAAINRLSMILICVYGVLFALLLVLFYFYFRKVGQKLNKAYTGLSRETEEHKKTKERIEQQNSFLKNIIESLPYPFYVIDAQTRHIMLANSATCSGALPPNATCYGVTHKLDEPCNNQNDPCPLHEVRRTKKPVVVEHIHFDSHGIARNVEVHACPILNSQGDIDYMIEYSVDISNRKRIANELLEARIRAEDATRMKSEFLANMSHEIRTPMNAIIGFGDLLCQEELSPAQKEYAEIILHSGRALLQLINDILDFSKIEAGKFTLDFTECSVRGVLKDIEMLFRGQIQKKNLVFEILTSSDMPETIYTDATRLSQCLINLVGNAIKFTSTGSVAVAVHMEELSGGSRIRFDVKDTGIGIPQAKQGSIFEAFTQADGGTSRKYGGTGLGLTITRKLVELMGGKISVTSEPGQGSTFSIELPIHAPAAMPIEV